MCTGAQRRALDVVETLDGKPRKIWLREFKISLKQLKQFGKQFAVRENLLNVFDAAGLKLAEVAGVLWDVFTDRP